METAARHGGDMKLSALFHRGRSGKNGIHPLDNYLDSLTPNTRKTYAHILESIARTLSNGKRDARTIRWESLNFRDDLKLLASLQEGVTPKTANLRLTVYRQWVKAMRRMKLIPMDRVEDMGEVKNLSGHALPAGRALSVDEVNLVLDHCEAKQTPKGLRDCALVSVLYGSGMRRGEAIALQLADYRPGQSPELIIRGGKGRKDRAVDLASKFQRRVDAWVKVRGSLPGPLFCPVGNGGYVYVGKLHPQTVTDLMRSLADECGLSKFTPHDLRRTFATHLRDAGVRIEIAAELMGHSSIMVTALYYRSSEEKCRQASCSLPGGGQ